MDISLTQQEQNLLYLQKAIPESERLYFWSYSPAGALYAATCPEKELFSQAFEALGGLKKALAYAKEKRETPLLIGSSIGMQWAVTLEAERNRDILLVIGPVFYQPPLERELRFGLRPYNSGREEAGWAASLIESISSLPVMSYAVFIRYVIMVHNIVNNDQLGLDGLFPEEAHRSDVSFGPTLQHDRVAVYLAEQALLQTVRNGDISYQNALQDSIQLSSGTPVRGADPLRQAKTSITVFTTLVSRAAMEGGLSPEIAYPLGDSYLQNVESCTDSGELSALAMAMYHDFLYRVHHLRTDPSYSHAIQKCCDYIELSLDRKIRTSELAALVGYAEYYLTDKFKKETGVSLNTYIRRVKIERAKVLLTTTSQSIQQISDSLAFTTPNYFIRVFHQTAGCSPAQYRKRFRTK